MASDLLLGGVPKNKEERKPHYRTLCDDFSCSIGETTVTLQHAGLSWVRQFLNRSRKYVVPSHDLPLRQLRPALSQHGSILFRNRCSNWSPGVGVLFLELAYDF